MENNRNAALLEGDDEVITASAKQVSETQNVEQNVQNTFFTDALGELEVNKLVKDSRPELIVLLGLNDFGKSTFVGSLYHLLRSKGYLGDIDFYDSETYVGFEKRVYLRRVESTGSSTTKRTIRGENSFLHLRLRKKTVLYDVVISDRSGEDYRDYISKDELILKDKAIKQADKLLVFVDSSRLYGRFYSSMYDDLQSLMHRLKDKNKLPQHAVVYVIFNKIDLKAEKDKDRCEHEDKIRQMIQETFGGQKVNPVRLNSKSLDNNADLENFFTMILQPNGEQKNVSELDWVNNDKI